MKKHSKACGEVCPKGGCVADRTLCAMAIDILRKQINANNEQPQVNTIQHKNKFVLHISLDKKDIVKFEMDESIKRCAR